MASMANEASILSTTTTTRLLACDVGTGSVRVGIFDLAGKLFHHVNRKIDVYTPKDDYKEQSSNNIWLMTCECIREVLVVTNTKSKDIQGIAFDATCSLVCLDENDKPICISPKDTEQNDEHNIIQWCDHRSINEAEEINKTKDETLQYVGGKVSAEMEIPKILWIKTKIIKTKPMLSNASRPAAVIIVIMIPIANIDIIGIALSSQINFFPRNLLNKRPAPMGRIIIFTILHIIANTSISMNSPAKNFINNGVTKGAIKVAIEVMVIDKAKFALAKYAITFEATPLGEQPIKTIPAAISGGKLLNFAKINPIIGIIPS